MMMVRMMSGVISATVMAARQIDLIISATAKCGGVYLYANQCVITTGVAGRSTEIIA
jgi:hypothetical protein